MTAHGGNVPKILGADVELSNFILGVSEPGGTGQMAAHMLLAAIDGIDSGNCGAGDALDFGRKYLPANGGCAYIDSNHAEIALCETFSAFDHVAHWRAMLALVRRAMRSVNDRLPDGCRLHVLANCSDGLGNSYGSHVNVLVTRAAWHNMLGDKPHHMAYLAAFQISSIVFTGQGKVGSERGRAPAEFQLSQRADFMETLSSIDTMVHRGVLNTRHEPHCGSALHPSPIPLARLHAIFFDSTLCQVATVLRVGTLQMVTAMLEAGVLDARLALDDPLGALRLWSRDPALSSRARLTDGTTATAVELQWHFFEAAQAFAATGRFDGIVPEASRLLALWGETLRMLDDRNLDALSRRLDWVAKHRLLTGLLDRNPGLSWQSPVIKQLDQLFASIDDGDGPFWALERSGQIDRVVDDEAIERAAHEPPSDTRAWTRAHLLRLAGPHRIQRVDWDRIVFRTSAAGSLSPRARTVHLPLPFGATQALNAHHFHAGASLETVLDALRADHTAPPAIISSPNPWIYPTGGPQ